MAAFCLIHPLARLFAADAGVDVTMSLQVLNVQVLGGSLDVGVSVGQNGVLDRIILKNTGNGSQDYAVSITGTDGGWTPVSTAPGPGQYRLQGIWHQWDVKPGTGEFQSDDILTSSDQTSSDSRFFNNSETHATGGVKGYSIPPTEERNLYLWVQGPSSGGGSATSHVGITVSASP